MLVKRIAAPPCRLPIYLQPFTSYIEILVGNCNFYLPLHLTHLPPLGCSQWNSGEKFDPRKTRIMGLPGNEASLTTGWAVSTSTQYQRVTDRQTDGLTDRRTLKTQRATIWKSSPLLMFYLWSISFAERSVIITVELTMTMLVCYSHSHFGLLCSNGVQESWLVIGIRNEAPSVVTGFESCGFLYRILCSCYTSGSG